MVEWEDLDSQEVAQLSLLELAQQVLRNTKCIPMFSLGFYQADAATHDVPLDLPIEAVGASSNFKLTPCLQEWKDNLDHFETLSDIHPAGSYVVLQVLLAIIFAI